MKNAKTVIWIIAAIGAVVLAVVLFRPQGGSVEHVDDAILVLAETYEARAPLVEPEADDTVGG